MTEIALDWTWREDIKSKRNMQKDKSEKTPRSSKPPPSDAHASFMALSTVGRQAQGQAQGSGQDGLAFHPKDCACGLHLMPNLFEMAMKRKKLKEQKEKEASQAEIKFSAPNHLPP